MVSKSQEIQFEFSVILQQNHTHGYAESARTDYVSWNSPNVGEAPVCSICKRYIGMLRWLPPYEVELECWGYRYGDISFGTGDGLLVSDRFCTLWNEAGLTGLRGFEPVKVKRTRFFNKKRGAQPQYYHVTVVSGHVAIDYDASGFRWYKPPQCPECRVGEWKYFKSIQIEEGTWNRQDIFVPRGLNIYLASDRFRHFWQEHELDGIALITASQYQDASCYPPDDERPCELMAAPLSNQLVEKVLCTGELVRYYSPTNEIVIAGPDGRILNHFKSLEGIEYWKRVKGPLPIPPNGLTNAS